MQRRVELLDTSILVEILEVPFESDHIEEITAGFEKRQRDGVELHLPLAAVVESGSHIGRIDDGTARRHSADLFARAIDRTLKRQAPWSFNPVAWDEALLGELIEPTGELPISLVDSLAQQHLEMGDLLVVAEFQRLRGNLDRGFVDLDVWTLDTELRGVVDALRDAS